MSTRPCIAKTLTVILQNQERIHKENVEILNTQEAILHYLDDSKPCAWFARKVGLCEASVLRLISRAEWLNGLIPEFTAVHTPGGRITWQVSARAYKAWYSRERKAALLRVCRPRNRNHADQPAS
jgi:hypothetical protein